MAAPSAEQLLKKIFRDLSGTQLSSSDRGASFPVRSAPYHGQLPVINAGSRTFIHAKQFSRKNPEKLLKKLLTIQSFSGKLFSCSEPIKLNTDAALAQLVERRLGKAEVGGSNPLGSFEGISDQRFLFYSREQRARRTCLHAIWQLPRGSKAPQLCCATSLMPRSLLRGF